MTTNIKNTESELLSQIVEGSETAFSQLFMQWQPVFASYIFRITKTKELTEEIVQDVFLKIWINRASLSHVKNFKSYLFTMSRNEAINALRKMLKELENLEQLENYQPSIDDIGAEDLKIVDEAIDRLSPRQKEIYLLHRHQRLTYQQIAIKLGIGKESVKTHLDIAVKSIKKYLLNRITLLLIIIANKSW